MDRHASTIKRHRQSLKRHARNRALTARLRSSIKQVESAAAKGPAEAALKEAIILLDKRAGTGILHRNKAARLKSRLSHLVATRFAS